MKRNNNTLMAEMDARFMLEKDASLTEIEARLKQGIISKCIDENNATLYERAAEFIQRNNKE